MITCDRSSEEGLSRCEHERQHHEEGPGEGDHDEEYLLAIVAVTVKLFGKSRALRRSNWRSRFESCKINREHDKLKRAGTV